MDNEIDLENTEFKDLKNQTIHEGDFIMYPILTFLRCGLVTKILGSARLSVKYIKPYYAPRDVDLLPDREDWIRYIALGRQQISAYARSVVKISEIELQQILPRHEFMYFMELKEKMENK